MTWLCRLLRSPSAFERDPWGWLRNQAGHAWLVGLLPVGMGAPWWLVLAVYAVWEAVQWLRYGAALSDCLEDMSHVLAGILIGLGAATVVPLHLVMLAAGTVWRLETTPLSSRRTSRS